MKNRAIVWLMAVCCAVTALGEPTLPDYRSKYESADLTIALEYREAEKSALSDYENYVAKAAEYLRTKGDLKGYLTLDSELKRFRSSNTVSNELADVHSLLANAVAQWNDAMGKARSHRNERKASLMNAYLSRLRATVETLKRPSGFRMKLTAWSSYWLSFRSRIRWCRRALARQREERESRRGQLSSAGIITRSSSKVKIGGLQRQSVKSWAGIS